MDDEETDTRENRLEALLLRMIAWHESEVYAGREDRAADWDEIAAIVREARAILHEP